MEIPFCWLNENGGTIGHYDHLNCSESALWWAALTVGAPSCAYFIQNIMDAPAFALHKWFAVRSVVDFQKDEIKLRDSYHILDPSEKGVLSYWMGMILAKLTAEEILNVPWMAHARLMKESGELQVKPSKTKSLPDLVGYGNSPDFGLGWHIVEAKGLQRNPSRDRREHYKEQIGVVESVSGEEPATRNYCITYLRSPISVELCDPKDVSRESIKIDISPLNLQKFYYRVFFAYFGDYKNNFGLKETENFRYKEMICGSSCDKRCCIGIAKEVFDQVECWKNNNKLMANKEIEPLEKIEVSKMIKEELFSHGDVYIGSDGIFVQIL